MVPSLIPVGGVNISRSFIHVPGFGFCVFILFLLSISWMLLIPEAGALEDSIVSGKFRVISEEEAFKKAGWLSQGSKRQGLTLCEIPKEYTGTGQPEWIEYQLPSGYDPNGPGHPLLVCWHGYGQSCLSVSIDSLIDEECSSRNWIFLSITGVHQCNFGFKTAQVHCTRAIDYMMDEEGLSLNIDLSRIYMAGFSMGGGAAISYACRHMGDGEGYPIAGLILVAPVYDWTHAYHQNDPGVMYWLPLLLGGSPQADPFAYKQISTLYMENGSYVLDQSLGQNVRHNLPVFVTYAGNDSLSYGPYQNGSFVHMMSGLNATYVVDYKEVAFFPHHWLLLDVDEAFDFIQSFTLEDQQTDFIHILADRDAKFYWAGVTQTLVESFSEVNGEINLLENELFIHEASNTDRLGIDRIATGLMDDQDLRFVHHSSSATEQVLDLTAMSLNPTYIVNHQGVLHPEFVYSSGEQVLSITMEPSKDLDLKIAFESYQLLLNTEAMVQLGQTTTVELGNGEPYDPVLLLTAVTQKETKIGMHHLLVYPFFPTFWFFTSLNAAGSQVVSISVPNDPSWAGITFYQQFLTYNTSIKEISNLAATTIY